MRVKGFTLIELLVVVGIVAVVASILFPVFAQGRAAARKTACLSNLKQWGLGFNMYVADFDDTFPNQEWRDFSTEDQNGDSSWIDAIQPYAEEATNINALGADMTDQDGLFGKTRLNVCPSQIVDIRAGMYADGTIRPYKAGVKQSYGMSEWSVGAWRPFSLFQTPTSTILLGENYLNYNQTLFYPVDADQFDADTYQFAASCAQNTADCRFDREVDCRNSSGFFPAHPEVMPGVPGHFASNLGNRHAGLNNTCFVDGHAKALANASTYKPDGSFSMWTISNTWGHL
jgi:prepilin-type N-terminal cleavage/methylation domain-containing protein/prepilin-type processing-associated H-X9-DG protein